MLSVPNAFLRPKEMMRQADLAKSKFAHPDGDHMTLLNTFESYKYNSEDPDWCWNNFVNSRTLKSANDVRNQLVNIMESHGHSVAITPSRPKAYIAKIKKAILGGYFMQVAHHEKAGHYITLKDNQIVAIHPSVAIDHKPEWCLYHELVLTNKNYIRNITEVEPEWLFEASEEYFDLEDFKNGNSK